MARAVERDKAAAKGRDMAAVRVMGMTTTTVTVMVTVGEKGIDFL
jgi:hypothetical protein